MATIQILCIILMLSWKTSSLFTWTRNILVPESDLQFEGKLLCDFFNAIKGAYNISFISHTPSILEDSSQLVSMYF